MHDRVGYSFELMFFRSIQADESKQHVYFRNNAFGFHNNTIVKKQYDNRGLSIQHHEPQADILDHILIGTVISHNSAINEEAPQRQKLYS